MWTQFMIKWVVGQEHILGLDFVHSFLYWLNVYYVFTIPSLYLLNPMDMDMDMDSIWIFSV